VSRRWQERSPIHILNMAGNLDPLQIAEDSRTTRFRVKHLGSKHRKFDVGPGRVAYISPRTYRRS